MGRPKKIKAEQPKYSAVLKLNGTEFLAAANILEGLFEQFKPAKFCTRGVLTVDNGDKKIQKILNILQMKRLFGVGGATTRKIHIAFVVNNFKFLLGEK